MATEKFARSVLELGVERGDFNTEIARAEAEVNKLVSAFGKYGTSVSTDINTVNKLMRDFTGIDAAKAAEEMAGAVAKIGGASKLTAADQQRVNKAVNEALEHYRALGVQAPAHLHKLAAETKEVQKSTGLLQGQWASMTSAFTGGMLLDRAITGLVSFGTEAIDAAGAVADLSAKTGLSTRAVQIYGQVVKEAGGSVEGMANAVFKLGINIAKGGTEISSALDKIGLSYEQVKNLKPEAQFELIAEKLQGITNVQERNLRGTQLFGKTWSEVAPAVEAGLKSIADKTHVMSDEQIKALDAAADAWDRWVANRKANIGSFLATLVIAAQKIADLQPTAERLSTDLSTGFQNAKVGGAIGTDDAAARAAEMKRLFPKFGGGGEDINLVAEALGTVTERAADARKELSLLTGTQIATLKAAQSLGVEIDGYAKEFGLGADAVKLLNGYLSEQERATKSSAKATKDAAKEQAEALAELQQRIEEERAALRSLGLVTERDVTTAIDKLGQAHRRAGIESVDMRKFLEAAVPALKDLEKRAKASGLEVQDLTDNIEQFQEELDNLRGAAPVLPASVFQPANTGLDELLRRFKAVDLETMKAGVESRRLASAYDLLGITATRNAKATADAAIKALDLIKASGTATAEEIEAATEKAAELSKKAAGATETAWRDALKNTGQFFVAFSQVAGGSMGEVARLAGQVVVAIDAMVTAQAAMAASKSWAQLGAGAMQWGTAAISMISQVYKFFEGKADKDTENKWAAARIQWQQDIADSIGVDVMAMAELKAETLDHIGAYSRDLAIRIGAEAARAQAEAQHLAEIIDSIGGLTAENSADFERRALPLFDVIARDGVFAREAIAELTELIDVFADQAEKTGGLWSESFQEIIARSREAGIGLERITQLVDGQLARLGSATGSVVGGLVQALAPASKAIDELREKQKTLEGEGDTDGAAKIGAEIAAKTASAVAQNQAEFDRLNRLALASFNAFIGQGKSATEAIAAVGPAIDALQGSADQFGFAWSEAFGELSRWRDLTTDNAALLESISGTTEMMTALANVGALTADTFADLQAQGQDGFEQLTAAGFSQQEALTQMAPMLEAIIKLHEERGFAIDEETQALIDQAREQGVLQEEQLDTATVLKDGLSEIIRVLGGELPKAWRDMAGDAANAAKQVEKEFQNAAKEIDRSFRDLKYDVPVTFSTGDVDWPTQAPSYDGYATGTRNLDFARFSARGTPAFLHNDEAVIPRGGGHELAAEIVAGMRVLGGNGSTGGMLQANVIIDGQTAARALVPYWPDESSRYRGAR